jgi:hypothetical protein
MNTLFLIYLLVEAIFGIVFLFAPELAMGPMGVTLDEISATFARMFGSLLIGIPVLVFFARKSSSAEFRRGVMYCVFIYLLASTVVLLITQLKGLMNSLGWSIVVLHFAFMLWFGYYLLKPGKNQPESKS